MRATGGLLAQSAGGRDRRIEGKGGGQLGRELASTQRAGPGALEQWVASKQQAVDTEHGVRDTHIVLLCLLPCLCSCSLLLLVSSSVQRWQPCKRQGSSSFNSRPAAQQLTHNEL